MRTRPPGWQTLLLYSFYFVALLGSLALADTFSGRLDPYNKSTTITVPEGYYLRPDAAISTTSSIYAATGIVSDAGISARSATVSGNVSVSGALTVDGGLQLQAGSSALTKYIRGTVTIWGADAGINEGTCTPDQTFAATGITSNSMCFMQNAETMGEKYRCEIHYSQANELHWECCCNDSPTCGWVAPTTTGYFCIE